jgi:hypothetical protein
MRHLDGFRRKAGIECRLDRPQRIRQRNDGLLSSSMPPPGLTQYSYVFILHQECPARGTSIPSSHIPLICF